MNTRSARPLVESALLAALGAVMALIAWYVPVIGVVAGLVSPLPAAVVVIRHGTRWGVMSSLVTMLVLAPLIGWPNALALWVVNGAMGISFGFAVRRRMSPSMVLVTAAGGCLTGVVAEFASAYFILGLTLTKQIEEIVNMWNQALELNKKILGPNPALDEIVKMMPTTEMYMALLPGLAVITAFVMAYINFELFRRVLPRLGYTLEALPPFSRWIFPPPIAFAGIMAMLLSATQAQFNLNLPLLTRLVENVSVVASMLFFLEALAVATFYLMRAGFSRVLAGLVVFMGVSLMVGNAALSTLTYLFGMIDILFDFRHVRSEPVAGI